MTSSAPPKVNFEPVDFSSREHRALLFDLALTNKDYLLNDADNDIVLIIGVYEQRERNGETISFVPVIDGKNAGCFWIEIDRYGIGRIRGALLPEYRNVRNLIVFLRQLVAMGFEAGLRKLDAELTLYSRHDRQSAAVEKVLKRIGFAKVGIIRESLMIGGKPKDTILLDFLRKDYDVKRK